MTPYPTAPGCCWHCLVNHRAEGREKKREKGVCSKGERRTYREWIRSRSKLKISPKVVTPAGSAVKRCKGYRICRVTQVMLSRTHRCTHTHTFQLVTRHFIYSYIPEDPDTRTCNHTLIYDSPANAHRERQTQWGFNSDGWRMSASGAFEKWNIVNNEGIFCFMDRRKVD